MRSGTPRLTRFRTAVRRRSWRSIPSTPAATRRGLVVSDRRRRSRGRPAFFELGQKRDTVCWCEHQIAHQSAPERRLPPRAAAWPLAITCRAVYALCARRTCSVTIVASTKFSKSYAQQNRGSAIAFDAPRKTLDEIRREVDAEFGEAAILQTTSDTDAADNS